MVDLKKYVQSGGTKKMKKSLFILGALAAMSMIFMGCPNSSTSDPTTTTGDDTTVKEYLAIDADTDLGSGWKSTYDGATKTITWTEAYGGRGWWFGGKDASDFSEISVVFSNATGSDKWLKLVVQYEDDTMSEKDGVFDADGFTLTAQLDASKKSSIKQAYIQGKAEGNTATIKEAYFK